MHWVSQFPFTVLMFLEADDPTTLFYETEGPWIHRNYDCLRGLCEKYIKVISEKISR